MAKHIQAKGELEVKKGEAIVKARYKLSPLAIKFISVIISNLKRSDNINEEYVIKVKDFKELTGQKTKRIYELIDEALDDLLKNPLTIPIGDDKNSILKANWVSGAIYNKGEVRFMIYPKLRPFLLEVKEKFLKYKLENILSLRSSYSIRIYEILKDWLELNKRYGNKAEKIISVKEFREILEIPKSYVYGMLKKRILEKAKSELAENTDIVFDYEEIKTGRKVTHLKFIIKSNPNKIQLDDKQEYNLRSLKHFVSFLRKNYSGNLKAFGYKNNTDNKVYWLKMDKDGLVYGFDKKNGNIEFNAIESERIYKIWWEVAKENSEYYELLEQGLDLEKIYKDNVDFRMNLIETINFLKEEGVI